jgi:hypothetical protein
MLKSLRNFSLFVITVTSFSLFSQNVVEVPWTGTPGEVEAAVAANGGTGSFKLEDGKTYLMLDHIPVPADGVLQIMGSGSTDMHPATLQPTPNAEGVVSLTDGQMFNLVGDNAELHLHHLVLNLMPVNASGGQGCAAARANLNKIVVDNCFISGASSLAFHTMGQGTDFHITNSIMDGWTSYAGGAFYGGAVWGGGSWMGTMDTLILENNTIHGVIGEAIVAYTYVDEGSRVNQNTFANVSMGAFYTYVANNLDITNNLFYNNRAYGQSSNDVTGWGVVAAGGWGQLATRLKIIGTQDVSSTDSTVGLGTYTMGDGQVVSLSDRNQNWSNNAVVWSPALVSWMETMIATPWSWDVTADDGTVTTVPDTMMSLALQTRVHGDTALAAVAAGVGYTSSMNAVLTSDDLGSNIAEEYIIAQQARTLDFRDNQATDGVAATHEWVYQNDNSHTVVEWPWHLDVSYATTSTAYTHSLDGLPVGNLHAFPDKLAEWQTLSTDSDNKKLAPANFSLAQNYPNPFNPSTEIAYNLNKTSNINLTIFNVIGQKVKVLENSSKQAGTHTAKWDGRDEFGASVSTGLYFYTLSDGTSSFTRKMALMK